MSLNSMLSSTGTLYRYAVGQGRAGGTTQGARAVLASNVACDVQPAGSSVILQYSQRQMNVTTRIYTDRNVGAEVGDIFVALDNEGVEHTFLVQGFPKSGSFGRDSVPWYLDCQEVL